MKQLGRFKENVFVVRFFHDKEPQVSPGYHGRLEFPAKKYSVKLKNATKADSGVYAAQKIGVKIQTLDEYNVTVQGRFVHISDTEGEVLLPCF